jgi:ElaB/YqjD/DUF883 family membrane-anchored ribosome-binding protein
MTATSSTKQQLVDELHNVMDDMDSLMSSGASATGSESQALRSRIKERLNLAKAQVSATHAAARERARQTADAADVFVHDNPWQAVGVAAAVGVIFGLLISRR